MAKTNKVVIKCYGTTRTYERKEAIEEFTQGILCSDGSERERYAYILAELMGGATMIDDENSF